MRQILTGGERDGRPRHRRIGQVEVTRDLVARDRSTDQGGHGRVGPVCVHGDGEGQGVPCLLLVVVLVAGAGLFLGGVFGLFGLRIRDVGERVGQVSARRIGTARVLGRFGLVPLAEGGLGLVRPPTLFDLLVQFLVGERAGGDDRLGLIPGRRIAGGDAKRPAAAGLTAHVNGCIGVTE